MELKNVIKISVGMLIFERSNHQSKEREKARFFETKLSYLLVEVEVLEVLEVLVELLVLLINDIRRVHN